MNAVRQELLRLIALNHAEQWIPTHIALQQLERFGDGLVPGLVECLYDLDAEIRCLAVELLGEAKAESAVAPLIERLQDDDELVRVSAIHSLADIGPVAIAAVPELEAWLYEPDEYLRVLAATAISQIEPSKFDDLLPLIEAAAKSRNAAVAGLAQDFLDEQDDSLSALLRRAVERHWRHHANCLQISWKKHASLFGFEHQAAPIFQEIVGGREDGNRVWAGFDFNLSGFVAEPGIEVERISVESVCPTCTTTVGLTLQGRWHGQPLLLRLHLEPIAGSDALELLDAATNHVRPKY